MKRLLANTLMLAGGLTVSGHTLALGLGELELDSALNQPLKAEIALVEVEDLSQWEIKPKLASPRDFENAGVDRVFFLTKIDFKVEDDKIILSTREPVTEPFLNFLVELNWPAGRVLREYTLLLDPPVFADDGEVAPLTITTPATVDTVYAEQPGSADQVETQVITTSSNADRQDWTQEPTEPGTYKVKPNDTLWNIALNTRPDNSVSPQRMMVAIQQANPDAFIGGNINRLKTHKVLRIPGSDDLDGVSEQQALAEVSRQNRDINASGAQLSATGRSTAAEPESAQQSDGEVRLLSPSEQQDDIAGSSGQVDSDMASGSQQKLENDLAMTLEELDRSRRANEELRERLQALEEQIGNLERLITLKDDQLANMQMSNDTAESESQFENEYSESAESDINDASEAMPEDSDSVDFNYSQPESNDRGLQQESEQAPAELAVETEPTPSAEELAAAEERRRELAERIARESNQAQPSMMDTLMQPILLGGSALVLALLGLVGYRVVRKRKESQQQTEDGLEVPVADIDMDADGGKLDDFDFDADADLEKETLDLGEDLGAHESDEALGDEVTEDFAPVAQTEDVISESDIYIAYGKFDQAVDLLTGAVEDEPSRTDLRLKLLEVLVEMDDGQAFAEAEGALNMLGDHQANEQAQQMRGRLSSPQTPATAAGEQQPDMSLDHEIPELDESLSDEFSEGLDFSDGLDISDDQGSEEVDDIFAGSSDGADGDALDFESALQLGDDAVADDGGLEDVPTLDLDADLDESLDFDLGETDEASTDDESALSAGEPSAAADDSLDFDLSAFSAGDEVGQEEDDTSATSALDDVMDGDNDGDDALEFDLSSLQDPEEPVAEAPAAPVAPASDNVLDFDLGDDDPVADVSDEESSALQDLEAALERSSFSTDDGEPRKTADGKEEVTNADEFMSELESLSEASAAQQDDDPGDFDLSGDMADLDSELEDFAVPEEAPAAAEPAPMVSEAPQTGGRSTDDIDLDELAAADDDFDFLAGTDECATKLDLARAYVDMEDAEGAKELLQEVLQEGSDQQKQEARSMMDSMN